jgi:hypothetical protein
MNRRTPLLSLVAVLAVTGLCLAGCSADSAADDQSDDGESEPSGEGDSALTSEVDCRIKTDTAYVSGSAKPIKLITVGGKPTSIAVGHQFLKMQKAADAAGVVLTISSGFRTMAEQQYFYHCYQTGSCNNGNLAAKPGYSNHQGGFALDLKTSSWLANNAGRFGFVRTVPSEAWHYEYHGPDTGGPCSGGGTGSSSSGGTTTTDPTDPPPTSDVTCRSATLGKNVPPGTCVKRADSGKWFVCDADAPTTWPEVASASDPACKTCPQLSGGTCP